MELPSLRRWILKTLLPLTKIVNKINFHSSHDISGGMAFEIGRLVKPGDVFVVYARGYATNLIIPGHYKHAAMYVGEVGGLHVVVEALGGGVKYTELNDFVTAKDRVLLVRPMFCDGLMGEQACVYAKTLVGKPYDYLIEYNLDSRVNEAFYCSEIPWWSYNRAMIAAGKKSPFVPRETMGTPTITPTDYALAIDKWAVVGGWPNQEPLGLRIAYN